MVILYATGDLIVEVANLWRTLCYNHIVVVNARTESQH